MSDAVQWFPGHMTKALREMREDIKSVDISVEILDARIPRSSRNREIVSIIETKPHILLLNRRDLADEKITAEWIDFYSGNNAVAAAVSCIDGSAYKAFFAAVEEAKKMISGRVFSPLRVMITGIPNSGKSTFINRIAGSAKTRAEDRPGVTKGTQWISAGGIDLLDTPGILWNKFEGDTGIMLAITGAVKDIVVDRELLACRYLDIAREYFANRLAERYSLEDEELEAESYDLLEIVAKKRHMVKSGGRADTERAAIMLLDEFRGGKLGRVSLERP